MADSKIKTSLACPQCGAANTRADMTCVNCGEWLPWAGGLNQTKSASSSSPWEEEVEFSEEPQLVLILTGLLLPPAGLLLCAYYSLNSPGKAKQAGFSALVGIGAYLFYFFARAIL